ncbi:MAG TPA: VOC family protein [Actinomycetota bacterium]
MPELTGVAHVALTVTDVARSAALYKDLFGLQTVVSGEDQYGAIEVMASDRLMIGLRAHKTTAASDRFDPARVGLDHVAFNVDSVEELEKWRARLDELNVSHSGVQPDDYGTHLNAKDPDGIAIEFYVLPGA